MSDKPAKGKSDKVKKSTKRRVRVKKEVQTDSGIQLRGNDDPEKEDGFDGAVVNGVNANAHTPMPTQGVYSKGRYTESDTNRDELLKVKREYTLKGEPFGKLMLNHDDLAYLKHKKQQEEYLKDIRLASYMIDPERIDTQERTFAMFPELKKIPDELHKESLSMQIRLKTLLRDGIIRGKEDHAFIMKVCRADTFLPLFPLWDPEGKMIKEAIVRGTTEGIGNFTLDTYYAWPVQDDDNKKRIRGIWNPIRWSAGYEVGEAEDEREGNRRAIQFLYKTLIIRKLYRGLRHMDNDTLKQFMNQYTPLLPSNDQAPWKFKRNTGNSYLKFFQNISGEDFEGNAVGPGTGNRYIKDW